MEQESYNKKLNLSTVPDEVKYGVIQQFLEEREVHPSVYDDKDWEKYREHFDETDAQASRISLLVNMKNTEYWEPSAQVLLHPSKHEPGRSRIIFHETIHFWQYCSQSFHARLAEEQWRSVVQYTKDQTILPPGPYQEEYTRKVNEVSAASLTECLARFWEVHAIGPHLLLQHASASEKRSLPENLSKNCVLVFH